MTLSALQLAVGVLYVLPLWLLRIRPAPKLDAENVKVLSPIGFCHAASHLSAVVGLGAGSVSFTHIVKVRSSDAGWCSLYFSCVSINLKCFACDLVAPCPSSRMVRDVVSC